MSERISYKVEQKEDGFHVVEVITVSSPIARFVDQRRAHDYMASLEGGAVAIAEVKANGKDHSDDSFGLYPDDLTNNQRALLHALSKRRHGGSIVHMTNLEITAETGILKNSVASIVAALEAKELITKQGTGVYALHG